MKNFKKLWWDLSQIFNIFKNKINLIKNIKLKITHIRM